MNNAESIALGTNVNLHPRYTLKQDLGIAQRINHQQAQANVDVGLAARGRPYRTTGVPVSKEFLHPFI